MPTILSRSKVSAAVQDYLKRCYRLEKSNDGKVSISMLAKAMNVSAPSATNMVKRLASLNLVKRRSDGKIKLSPQGNTLALEVIRHHRLLETFLVNEMGMDWAEAHEEAEILEHYISERFEALLDKRLSKPTRDPHGEPIPSLAGAVPKQKLKPILECVEQENITIQEIQSRDPAMLNFLQAHKLTPGTKIRIEEFSPFDGPVLLKVGKKTQAIGRNVAKCIYSRA